MKQTIKPVELNDLKESGILYLENINQGFEQYHFCILNGDQKSYLNFLIQLYLINGEKHSYFDFYYQRLNEAEQAAFVQCLSPSEYDSFKRIELSSKSVYYPLDQNIIPLLLDVSFREVLFTTFYFTKIPCTLWSNYNAAFPMFVQDADGLGKYQTLAATQGLRIT